MTGKVFFDGVYGPIQISNTEININTTAIEGATGFPDPEVNLKVGTDQLESMTNYIMTTGKVPNGTYVFNFI